MFLTCQQPPRGYEAWAAGWFIFMVACMQTYLKMGKSNGDAILAWELDVDL